MTPTEPTETEHEDAGEDTGEMPETERPDFQRDHETEAEPEEERTPEPDE